MLSDAHAAKRSKIESCATCRFFLPTPKGNQGECRRMPPAAGVTEGHPTTYPDGWCGEFKEDALKIAANNAQEK